LDFVRRLLNGLGNPASNEAKRIAFSLSMDEKPLPKFR